MEYLTTLYRDASTCGISHASSNSPGKTGWAQNTAWFLQHLNAKIITILTQWNITVLIWRLPSGLQHNRVGVCSNTNFIVLQYVPTQRASLLKPSSLPISPSPFCFVSFPPAQIWLDDFKSSSFFYFLKTPMLCSIRSVVDFFPRLPAVLPFRLQETFGFPLYVIPAST